MNTKLSKYMLQEIHSCLDSALDRLELCTAEEKEFSYVAAQLKTALQQHPRIEVRIQTKEAIPFVEDPVLMDVAHAWLETEEKEYGSDEAIYYQNMFFAILDGAYGITIEEHDPDNYLLKATSDEAISFMLNKVIDYKEGLRS